MKEWKEQKTHDPPFPSEEVRSFLLQKLVVLVVLMYRFLLQCRQNSMGERLMSLYAIKQQPILKVSHHSCIRFSMSELTSSSPSSV
jgi:hypothetical protein